jgi:thiamine pyrophosphate-dependent acetolactate synthase large subunit-like protein
LTSGRLFVRFGGSVAEQLATRVLQAFGAAGADVVFGLPGVHNLAFWRSAGAGAPRLISVRHEQTAVYAADGAARSTGGIGAAVTTTGPGAANAVAAFGEASASGSPVLLVATEVPSRRAREGRRGLLHQSRDQAGLFEPLAKAVFRPRSVEEARGAISEAVVTAMRWPRGPVYVDVPADLLAEPCGEIELGRVTKPLPGDSELAELARRVNELDRLVIWAGGGVVQSEATEQLRAVAEQLNAPVIETFAARGVLPPEHPLRLGIPPHEPAVQVLMSLADGMLAVGSDFDGMMTRNWAMTRPPFLGVIDVDASRPSSNYLPDAVVQADAGAALARLLPLLEQHSGWCEPGGRLRARVLADLREDGRSGPALEFVEALQAVLGDGAAVLADMCIAGYWTAGYCAVPAPRTLQYPMGWGTLGYALPASIGVAATGRSAIVVVGDGGALFAIGELATLAQENLPVTVLVVDDDGYGMLRFDQDRAGDARNGVDLVSPDFVALARAFGIKAQEVPPRRDSLETALKEGLSSGEPNLICTKVALHPPRTTSPRWHDDG